MLTLYHTKVSASSVIATTAQSGFPANNVLREEIGRPWKATSGGANDLTLTWGVASNVAAVMLQDVNFDTCNILTSADGSSFAGSTACASLFDKKIGRYRSLLVINTAGRRGVRISIGAGTPNDGSGAWKIGAVYIFGVESVQARMPEYGTRVDAMKPKHRIDLENGRVAVAIAGPEALVLSLPFDRRASEDLLELVRRAATATVGLYLAPTNYPELIAPVRYVSDRQEETHTSFDHSAVSVEVMEAV